MVVVVVVVVVVVGVVVEEGVVLAVVVPLSLSARQHAPHPDQTEQETVRHRCSVSEMRGRKKRLVGANALATS